MKHPVDVHVGKRIRQKRWMVGMTQQQLGTAIGIKFQQVQKYETGVNRVSASKLWNICEALGVEVGFFFEGLADEGKMTDSNSEMPVDVMADREALALVRSYYSIPEDQRRRVFDLVRALTKLD